MPTGHCEISSSSPAEQILVTSATSQSLTRSRILPEDSTTYQYEVRACAGSGASRQCSPYRGTAHACVGIPNAINGPQSASGSAYDAFGKARNGDYSDRPNGTLDRLPDTLRGFTGHPHVDAVQLIHMGGRLYDYQLGRFLSVDPVIQFPTNTQSLNPYSYILNNPLSGRDPSGYCSTGTHITGGSGPSCEGLGVSVMQIASPSVSEMKAMSDRAMSRSYMQSIFNGNGSDAQTSKGASSTPLNGQASNIGAQSGTVGSASATDQSTAQTTYERMSQGNIFERADAAFVAGFGQTYAAWQSLFTGQPGRNPFSGATVEGVEAWNERFLSAATLAIPEGKIGEALKGVRGASAVKSIATPRGPALQETTSEALTALGQVQNGATVYRAGSFGIQNAAEGQFWSLQNPAITPGYAGRMGMPGSTAPKFNWIMGGRVSNSSDVITRSAPGIGANKGGAIEAVVAPGDVRADWFHMLDRNP